MTNYATGARFERAIRDKFREHPCVALVVRSAGSKGKVDLVVIRAAPDVATRDALLVQCKTGGAIEKEELKQLGRLAQTSRMVAVVASRGRPHVFQPVDWDGNYGCSPMTIEDLLHSYLKWGRYRCQEKTMTQQPESWQTILKKEPSF